MNLMNGNLLIVKLQVHPLKRNQKKAKEKDVENLAKEIKQQLSKSQQEEKNKLEELHQKLIEQQQISEYKLQQIASQLQSIVQFQQITQHSHLQTNAKLQETNEKLNQIEIETKKQQQQQHQASNMATNTNNQNTIPMFMQVPFTTTMTPQFQLPTTSPFNTMPIISSQPTLVQNTLPTTQPTLISPIPTSTPSQQQQQQQQRQQQQQQQFSFWNKTNNVDTTKNVTTEIKNNVKQTTSNVQNTRIDSNNDNNNSNKNNDKKNNKSSSTLENVFNYLLGTNQDESSENDEEKCEQLDKDCSWECKYCGEENRDEATKFCSNCGKPNPIHADIKVIISNTNTLPSKTNNNNNNNNKNKNNTINKPIQQTTNNKNTNEKKNNANTNDFKLKWKSNVGEGKYEPGESRQCGWILSNTTNTKLKMKGHMEKIGGNDTVKVALEKCYEFEISPNEEVYMLCDVTAPIIVGKYSLFYQFVLENGTQATEILELNVHVQSQFSEEKEKIIEQIVKMGFNDRNKIIFSLQNKKWNSQQAVEQLLSS